MAYRDGTGPMGEGPMTGRGMGPCNPNYNPETDRAYGRGMGRGRGRGRGMGYCPFGPGRGMGRGFGWGPMEYDMVPGAAYRELEARIAALEEQLNGESTDTTSYEEDE